MTIAEAIEMCPVPTRFVGNRFKRFSAVLEIPESDSGAFARRKVVHFNPLEWKSRAGALALIRESYPTAKAILVTR